MSLHRVLVLTCTSMALIGHIADLLWFRDWWVLGVSTEDGPVLFGPFADEAEARSYGQKYEGALVPRGWGVARSRVSASSPQTRPAGEPAEAMASAQVEGCGCPPYSHAMDGTSRGKCVVCRVCPKYEQVVKKKVTRKPRKRPREAAARRAGMPVRQRPVPFRGLPEDGR